MISFVQKGDFSNLSSFLEKTKEKFDKGTLDKYGRQGVAALNAATPRDTGLTASSWYYVIEQTSSGASLNFCNSNIVNDWANISILLQYGHGTKNGGWVEGRDYINPALKPVIDELLNSINKEVG